MKKNNITRVCIVLLSILYINVNAQGNKQSAFTFNYNYQIPIGELAKSFGHSSAIETSYFLEKSNNMLIGIEAAYMFGSNLKDSNIFDNITTSSGAIIGGDGYYANVNLMQRGWNAHLLAGYAFHFSEKNLSGIYIYQGLGYLQHQIFIDTRNPHVPQLNEEMKKGYDRFSDGYSTKFIISYKYYDKNGRFQMNTGLNYTLAYTKNQRTYDFANNTYYSQQRNWDKLLGVNIGIIIPINRANKEEFHYF